MQLHHALFDGSPRPDWAGPVTLLARNRTRQGRRKRAIEVSGVVLPVRVPPRYVPTSGHGHTFGLALGFPDLSEHLLDPSGRPRLSHQWSRVEQAIAESAKQMMGWRDPVRARALLGASPPERALHLRISGHVPLDDDDDPHDPSNNLEGEVSKLQPIRDVSGLRVRLQQFGSPSTFTVDPWNASWSRDPRHL